MVTQPQGEQSTTRTKSQLTTGNRVRGANANRTDRDNRLLINVLGKFSFLFSGFATGTHVQITAFVMGSYLAEIVIAMR